jgi:hypothetical protein
MSAAVPVRRMDDIAESTKDSITDCIAALDPGALGHSLDQEGFAVIPSFVDAHTCAQLAQLYDDASEETFRSTVNMARHGFGSGEYKYFARPLPILVTALREALYERLAPIANSWSECLGDAAPWPASHGSLVTCCAAAGQTRPTPLLLRYGTGDYNCLADAAAVGDAIAEIIDMPFGKRPFCAHIDPTHDGAEVSFAVIDRMRTEMLHRVGLDELLVPAKKLVAEAK